jgi:hypothetical protein
MYFKGKQKGLILISTDQDFPRDTLDDEISACYDHREAHRTRRVSRRKQRDPAPVRKTVAGHDVDTILLAQPKADFPPNVLTDGLNT